MILALATDCSLWRESGLVWALATDCSLWREGSVLDFW